MGCGASSAEVENAGTRHSEDLTYWPEQDGHFEGMNGEANWLKVQGETLDRYTHHVFFLVSNDGSPEKSLNLCFFLPGMVDQVRR